MRYVSVLFKLFLFAVLLSFAIENSGSVVMHYYFGYQWRVPLILLILLVFSLGAAMGSMACLPYLFRQRRTAQLLRQELAACRALPPLPEHKVM